MLRIAAFSLFAFSFALIGHASDGLVTNQQIPDVLLAVQAHPDVEMDIIGSFEAGSGLTGWVVKEGLTDDIIYTTEDGKRVIIGALLDAQLRNVTDSHKNTYFTQPDRSEAFNAAETMHWVRAFGNESGPIVYAFFDLMCGFCQSQWDQLSLLSSTAQIRIIPVSVLGEESTYLASQLLAESDTTAALNGHYSAARLPMSAKPSSDHSRMILRNTAFLRALGMQGTPTLLMRNENGTVILREGAMTAVAIESLLGS